MPLSPTKESPQQHQQETALGSLPAAVDPEQLVVSFVEEEEALPPSEPSPPQDETNEELEQNREVIEEQLYEEEGSRI